MPTRPFTPGFRLSPLDILILLIGLAATIALSRTAPQLASAIAFVILHFFLFCNILRMSRPLELTWAAVFTALATITTTTAAILSWPLTFILAFALTVILTLLQIRRPNYHGILWQKLNPNLPAWWKSQHPQA